MKHAVLAITLFFLGLQLNAQDPDFSQYYATPLSLNPALAGTFNGTYRVGGIYRDAWRVASPVPLVTYAFNGEYRFQLNEAKKKPDFGAAGIRFFSDRTPLVEQNTNAISAQFAFHKALDQYSDHYLSFGIEAGLAQKNLNYENLNFEDEFNNINGFEGFTGEELQPNNFAYADFALGLNYSREIGKKNNLFIGTTLKHLSTPNVSFWKNNDSKNPDLVKVNQIPLLIGAQLSMKVHLNYRLSMFPRLISQFQGSHMQLFTGSTLRIDLLTNNKSAFHIGLFTRLSNTTESISFAHVVPFLGFEVSDMLIGFSYDLNLRDAIQEYQGLGVFEFSITYTGEVIEDSAFCPVF